MTADLSPESALERLSRMSPNLREAVVLDSDGRRLAGSPSLGAPARQLISHMGDACEAEVSTPRGVVYAARSERCAIAAVCSRAALPALMLYDMRVLLAELARPS